MTGEKYLICEDSPEGIFTAIYEAYALLENHDNIHIQIGAEENLRLFAAYLEVETDADKAYKTAETVRKRLGEEVYRDICHALAAKDSGKGEAVYKTVVCGFRMKNARQVMGNLTNRYVRKVFELSRGVYNEVHHWKGFLRFQELENGVLFARFAPKADIVSYLAPHFADRLPLCNFIIYDEARKNSAVHPASGEWFLAADMQLEEEMIRKYSEREKEYQELFTFFCHKISVKERKNLKLQQKLLPLWFQDYMVEFQK